MDRTDFGVMACSYPLWDRVLARLVNHKPACGRTGRERPVAIEPGQLYQVWFGTQTGCGHSVAGDYGAARGPGHAWDSGAIPARNDIACGSAKPYAIMVLDCGKKSELLWATWRPRRRIRGSCRWYVCRSRRAFCRLRDSQIDKGFSEQHGYCIPC